MNEPVANADDIYDKFFLKLWKNFKKMNSIAQRLDANDRFVLKCIKEFGFDVRIDNKLFRKQWVLVGQDTDGSDLVLNQKDLDQFVQEWRSHLPECAESRSDIASRHLSVAQDTVKETLPTAIALLGSAFWAVSQAPEQAAKTLMAGSVARIIVSGEKLLNLKRHYDGLDVIQQRIALDQFVTLAMVTRLACAELAKHASLGICDFAAHLGVVSHMESAMSGSVEQALPTIQGEAVGAVDVDSALNKTSVRPSSRTSVPRQFDEYAA
ncbi:MAG: hypothetical protein CMH30_04925 [Micavibrio sp.]|nr:hypothetical protein [Micavibrio sp.]